MIIIIIRPHIGPSDFFIGDFLSSKQDSNNI